MALNLLAYHIYRISELYYSFTTDYGLEYKCTFTCSKEYFKNYPLIASKVFSLEVVLVKTPKDKKLSTDPRIADTVITIVGNFLNSKINAVVYICDTSDGRSAARARKFNSWFAYEEHPSHQIIKVSTDVDGGGMTLYTALLVHRKNKLKNQFVQAYLELMDYDDEK
jgi:Family of unknown function (DUF6169)